MATVFHMFFFFYLRLRIAKFKIILALERFKLLKREKNKNSKCCYCKAAEHGDSHRLLFESVIGATTLENSFITSTTIEYMHIP